MNTLAKQTRDERKEKSLARSSAFYRRMEAEDDGYHPSSETTLKYERRWNYDAQ
jgi:hypothetical protein